MIGDDGDRGLTWRALYPMNQVGPTNLLGWSSRIVKFESVFLNQASAPPPLPIAGHDISDDHTSANRHRSVVNNPSIGVDLRCFAETVILGIDLDDRRVDRPSSLIIKSKGMLTRCAHPGDSHWSPKVEADGGVLGLEFVDEEFFAAKINWLRLGYPGGYPKRLRRGAGLAKNIKPLISLVSPDGFEPSTL